jgi:hypothetical protein
MYNPRLGRFMQPDPIGYGDGMNMYARTNGDPVNFTDPTGLGKEPDSNPTYRGDPPDLPEYPIFGRSLPRFREVTFSPGPIPFSGGTLDCSHLGCSYNPDIKVTGQKPKPSLQDRYRAHFAKVRQCAAEQFGLQTLLGANLVAAGQPVPGTKPFVTRGTSAGTSLAGIVAEDVFGNRTFENAKPTPVGGTRGSRLRMGGTKSVAKFAGRWVPFGGWALLIADAAQVSACAQKD